jgi:hypothetical protein
MKRIAIGSAALAILMTFAARADDKTDHESATGAAREALADKAEPAANPPTLPDKASARAKYVQQHIAHGKKGAEERMQRPQNGDVEKTKSDTGDRESGDADRDGAAERSAQGAAASAVKSANADGQAAAGQARATSARGGSAPGSGKPVTVPPHR